MTNTQCMGKKQYFGDDINIIIEPIDYTMLLLIIEEHNSYCKILSMFHKKSNYRHIYLKK